LGVSNRTSGGGSLKAHESAVEKHLNEQSTAGREMLADSFNCSGIFEIAYIYALVRKRKETGRG
jgi:hypothetical protein